jgi:hypothetical protein
MNANDLTELAKTNGFSSVTEAITVAVRARKVLARIRTLARGKASMSMSARLKAIEALTCKVG